MSKLYLYVVKSSCDPDRVTCSVPYRVDDEVIFFGPCKKRLREALRAVYLGPRVHAAKPDEALYVVGVNGGNPEQMRKIVWAGRVTRIMTFARAWHDLGGAGYEELRNSNSSPLHVRPLYSDGQMVGYEHVTSEHLANSNWVLDLKKSREAPGVRQLGRRLVLEPGVSPWDGFPRDACMVLQNLFFAMGCGLRIDDRLMGILRRRQPDKRIDEYAIFGYKKNHAVEGRTGSYLLFEGSLAEELARWVCCETHRPSAEQARLRDSLVHNG